MAPATPKYKLVRAEDSGAAGEKAVCAFFTLPQGCRNGANCSFVHAGTVAATVPAPRATLPNTTKNSHAMKQVRLQIAADKQGQSKKRTSSSPPSYSTAAHAAPRKRSKKQEPETDESTSTEEAEEEGLPRAVKAAVHIGPTSVTAVSRKNNIASTGKPTAEPCVGHDVTNPFLAVVPPLPATSHLRQPVAAAAKRGAPVHSVQKKRGGFSALSVSVPVQPSQSASSPASPRVGNGVSMLSKLSALPVTPFTIARKPNGATRDDDEPEDGELVQGEGEEGEDSAQSVVGANLSQHAKEESCQAEAVKEEVCVHAGSPWTGCVKATMEHARFEANYRALAAQKKGEADWIEAKKHGAWCRDLPHVLALDCEMCATRDPVSMEQDGKALIRLSVVCGHDEKQVLLDTLVLPSLPVIDYRTDIHGIRPEDLRQVMFTFRHAQAAMLHLCCTETVLIGHGLCNDLTALKMKHSRVVDTALLFEREDAPNHTPALKDVASALLGLDMADMHDSVADARVTLRIARHFLDRGPVAPVPRLPAAPNKKGRRAEAVQSCLLLHRIPSFVTAAHIKDMFQTRTHVAPVTVDPVATSGAEGSLGRATARFLSKGHADLAFATLTGPARPDKDGRLQKRVHLAGKKDYVQVRLMYAPGEAGHEGRDGEEEPDLPSAKVF